MIYWEITLRDHLLLPITPDSSGDTTYARDERENTMRKDGQLYSLDRDSRRVHVAHLEYTETSARFGF